MFRPLNPFNFLLSYGEYDTLGHYVHIYMRKEPNIWRYMPEGKYTLME